MSQDTAHTVSELREVLGRWKGSSAAASATFDALTPDMSLRRYFRILYGSEGAKENLIAMVFDSVRGPAASGDTTVNSFDSYLQLTSFLEKEGVAVPRVYYVSENPMIVLLEDLGDELLAHGLLRERGVERRPEEIENFYRAAISQAIAIQKIPPREDFFPYRRFFSSANYISEMEELTDFVLGPRGVSSERIATAKTAFRRIASELESFPHVLVHRDFHSWNLMIDSKNRLRVIDFQDALKATRTYDLVGLINDRDTDAALGRDLYRSLVDFFVANSGMGEAFYEEYDRTLLQRDIKVAGRFAKLVQTRGMSQYSKWIPGTLRRLGRTLERIVDTSRPSREYVELFNLLVDEVPEIKEGAETPLRLR